MILICPETPPTPQTLGHSHPAALVSIFGRPLLEHFLMHYADRGITHFDVIASDRPDAVRKFLGNGEKWGVTVTIHAWKEEPGLDKDFSNLTKDSEQPARVDKLPWMNTNSTMGSENWFKDCLKNPPTKNMIRPDYVESKTGIFIGGHSHFPEQTTIIPPCYIGAQVKLGNGCSIGPNVIIEDEAFLESGCEVRESLIGPSTYIGPDLTIDRSIVMHDWVLDWSIGTDHQISDPLLLGNKNSEPVANGILGRMIALIIFILLCPIVIIAALASLRTGKPVIDKRKAVSPVPYKKLTGRSNINYSEFPSLPGYLRRYPQLWSIIKGEFKWVGNRPLNEKEADMLESEYEKMWLDASYGLFSLADLHGVTGNFSEEEKLHSSFYAATQGKESDKNILLKCIFS